MGKNSMYREWPTMATAGAEGSAHLLACSHVLETKPCQCLTPQGKKGMQTKGNRGALNVPLPLSSAVITWLIQCVFVGGGELPVRDPKSFTKMLAMVIPG